MSSLAVDVHASLDLSGAVGQARDALLAHLDADPTLAALLAGDPATLVSGDFGATLSGLGSGLLASPEQLLAPLERALRELAGHLDLGPLGQLNDLLDLLAQIGPLVEKIVALAAPDIPALELGADIPGAGSFGDVINLVLDQVDLPNRLAPIDDLRTAVAAIDGLVITGDVGSLVNALAPVLLPLPVPALRQLRAHFDLLDTRLGRLPDQHALLAALDEWAVALDAMAAADVPTAAMRDAVNSARLAASAALDAAVDAAGKALDALDITAWIAELRRLLGLLPHIPAVRLDSLTADLAIEIGKIRALIGEVTDAAILDGIGRFRLQAHAWLDAALGGIPELLDSVEARLAELLASLPTRAFRAQLTSAVDALIDGVNALAIDAVPAAIDDALSELRGVVEGDVVGRIQAAVGGVVGQVEDAVGTLEAMLGDVTGTITDAVDEVQPVLARVQAAVAGFQTHIDEVVRLRSDIDLAGAARQSVAKATELQETVTKLTGGGVLPDALRPVLEQAADALERIDLSALIAAPAAEAVAQLRVELPDELTDLLGEVAALLRDALPVALIAELDAPVVKVSEALAGFDPAELLGGLTQQVDLAARTIESLDPRPHVAGAEEAFRAALARLDRLDPVRLLDPVSSVYDRLLDKLGGVDMQGVSDRLLGGFEAAGAPLSEVVSTAARRLGTESKAPPAAAPDIPLPAEPAAPADRPAPLYRPGDAIRALGAVLDRVRLALAPLDDAVLVPAFRELHALSGGLAQRATPDGLALQVRTAMDEAVTPLHIEAPLPATLRLRLAWDRAAARHQLDASTAPAVLFDARGPKVEALRRKVDDRIGDIASVGGALSVFCSGTIGAIPGVLTVQADGRGPVDAFLAQLDPEPVAAALDALAEEAVVRLTRVGEALVDALENIRGELEMKLGELGPVAITERLARLLLLVRQELDRMHPAELGRDVRPLLLAIRSRIETWSPVRLAGRVAETLVELAAALRALDPVALLGDLSAIDGLSARVAALAPGRQLAPLADHLGELGEQLAGLDIEASVTVITDTAADVLADLTAAVDVVLAGLADLLRALGSQAQLSVSLDVEVSVR